MSSLSFKRFNFFSIGNFVFNHFGWIFAGIFLLIVLMIFADVSSHKKFMDECTKDKKKYECEVLWKQAHPDPNTIVLIK
jgi:hypothetical protein